MRFSLAYIDPEMSGMMLAVIERRLSIISVSSSRERDPAPPPETNKGEY